MDDINISRFERAIAREYMNLYGHEGLDKSTIQIMNIAATAAAIAIKIREEQLNPR